MKVLLRICIAVSFSVLLFSGIVIAGMGSPLPILKNTRVIAFPDGSEPLEFDENGVVTNLGYPNVVSKRTVDLSLAPGEAEAALQSVLRVLPRLENGTHVGFLHHMPVNQRLSTHIAAGAFIAKGKQAASTDSTVGTDADNKGVDPMLQMGLTYKLSPGLSVTAEVQRFFIDEDEDLERYALGMVYTF